jgi:hypothetical protein
MPGNGQKGHKTPSTTPFSTAPAQGTATGTVLFSRLQECTMESVTLHRRMLQLLGIPPKIASLSMLSHQAVHQFHLAL